MPTIDEVHAQVDQGQVAVLSYNDENTNIKVSIRQNQQGQYTRTISYPAGPNPFPKPPTDAFNKWKYLLDDLSEFQKTSTQWRIE